MESGPRRILFPTDFSPGSAVAIPYAVALARANDAEIVMIHVSSRPGDEERRQLDAVVLPGEGIRVRRELVEASSGAGGIVDAAERERADLIVIASHGRGLLGQLFLGSVAKGVIAHAPCSVLCVKLGEEGLLDPKTGHLRLREVVVVVDDSAGALRAFETAASVSTSHEARLHLLYVLARDMPTALFAPDGEPMLHVDESLLRLARERKEKMLRRIESWRADVKRELLAGDEEKEIAAYATEVGADTVVMSREGIADSVSILGGAPVRLLHDIHCPLLLVAQGVAGRSTGL